MGNLNSTVLRDFDSVVKKTETLEKKVPEKKSIETQVIDTGRLESPVIDRKRKMVTQKSQEKVETKPAKRVKQEPKKTKKKRYEVEEVRGIMVKENVTYYLIKWKNYPESENSWEPSPNLSSCKHLVDEFLEKVVPQLDSDASYVDDSTVLIKD